MSAPCPRRVPPPQLSPDVVRAVKAYREALIRFVPVAMKWEEVKYLSEATPGVGLAMRSHNRAREAMRKRREALDLALLA